ncbi:MAG TPA: type VI secretion system-associated FHA domain protein TagH [Steroidobacteraceae bacterium]|jgi:type VI secretion system FHA domain protein|nr:type VI secretion system-associated FHA domain protein TagH [Steroidobacteraceae bacterium]
MYLAFEVVSPNGRELGAGRRKVFGADGGRIGRAPENDWVLPNPYVSRHHATVRCIGGIFYIESTGENGVAVGAPDSVLPQMERHRLANGDRLYIDEYEIAVTLSSAQPGVDPLGARSAPPAQNLLDDPFAPPATRSGPVVDPFEPASEDLDPLKQLTGRHPVMPQGPPPRDPAWNHTPALSDHFRPPPAPLGASPPPAGATGAIPDDWDRTSFGRTKFNTPGATPPPQAQPPASGGGAIPDDWDKTSFGRTKFNTPAPPPSVPPPAPPPRVSVTIETHAQVPTPSRAPPPPPPRAAQPVQRPAPLAPPPSQARPTSSSGVYQQPQLRPVPPGGALDVDQFLRSAGVDPGTVPPETAAAMGNVLRSIVQGVIDVLRARSEIKTEFRLPVTRVKTTENNPLKFSVNAEDALNSLLGKRNPAYMPAINAFDDAFDDIRFHQMAMLAGMRAAFEHMLERFEPAALQELFDRQLKRGGLLAMPSKMKYWELYGAMFAELAGDREDSFRRLFGEEFAKAYEEQLERLKRNRSASRR